MHARAGLNRLRKEGLQSPGMEYLDIEILLQEGEVEAAFERCLACSEPEMWGEQAAHRLCQLARTASESNRFSSALPRLREWTSRFPDGPDSGKVWLARYVCATCSDRPDEARECFEHARDLLGEHAFPAVV